MDENTRKRKSICSDTHTPEKYYIEQSQKWLNGPWWLRGQDINININETNRFQIKEVLINKPDKEDIEQYHFKKIADMPMLNPHIDVAELHVEIRRAMIKDLNAMLYNSEYKMIYKNSIKTIGFQHTY